MVRVTYELTKNFPRDERFGLTIQFRRAVVSIPANIAEGFGRRTTKELLQSLAVANGSLEEARYYAFLASDLGYIERTQFEVLENQCGSVARLMGGLRRSLQAKTRRTPVTGHRSLLTTS